MSRDLHPTDGARYLLERLVGDDAAPNATYRATVFLPVATQAAPMVTELLLTEAGDVAVSATATPLAEPFHKTVVTFAKLTARAAPSRRDEGLPTWPARVLRWRK